MKRRTLLAAGLGLGGLGGLGVLGIPGLAGFGLRRQAGAQLISGAALAFGTTISIQIVHGDRREGELAIDEALAAALNIDRLMTLHRPDSQLAILNRDGYLRRPDPHLLTVLASAQQLSTFTAGAFDITVQPLWHAYNAAAAQRSLPDEQQRRAALALVDYQQLAFDDERAALLQPGMAVTLNGIAQGHAVDVARAALLGRGIRHALLDTGEFAAHGRKDMQQDWKIGIRDPRDPQALACVLAPHERCVATSGDYATTFTPDFTHHHIFDPASGDSPGQLASATVLAPTGLQADGWSTALMVLGAEKGLALVSTLADVDVLLIGKDGRRWRSTGWPA
jgi:thiamine biosynthesis lipoprotein